MRHRITSFRNVAEDSNMGHRRAANKPCNIFYFRQSSMARAGSAQAGTARSGSPGERTAIRPRLNAITSRKASFALRMTALIAAPRSVTWPAGKRALRVEARISICALVPARMIVTCRFAASHCTTSCDDWPSP
ncbi:hypothetical protein Swit_0867 [Rhizorhabdus wittichii RW1]|uniref:Uncharacterized protein n=1 Tax=Rhizorhabdus wittichii (strain DSM 6014 / CCUG 31198 / JCM 15750 / NBRC 105917 / EY 4224 / RW1) TaxID=392499 RepID=A0A9J9LCN3_RHIWR|nr:hypothetical protein Swit_0867 [Rhizorhabdus wittichii RW1]